MSQQVLLFNDDEGSSGRGFANVGFKFRVYGKRSDSFRLAVDLQGRHLGEARGSKQTECGRERYVSL